MKVLKFIWIKINGPSEAIFTSVEFATKLAKELKYFIIKFNSVSTLWHNKLGFVDREDSVLRLLMQRNNKNYEYAI